MIIRLIRKVEEIKSDIIGKYNHVVIALNNPFNFQLNKKLQIAFISLSNQGKEYDIEQRKTNRGLDYLDCRRIEK